ncbi:MAG: hypothetical protein LBF63_10340 [Treponema sp.]|jgi:uroporphyrinogen-III decarboxylase|nr:hypothetical protein [Treponema sp.]
MAVKEMTSKERFMRMYAHREADRVPVIEESDHSIPNTVSLDTFRQIVTAVKQYGAY